MKKLPGMFVHTRRSIVMVLIALCAPCVSAVALAQTSPEVTRAPDANQGRVGLAGSFDLTNAYMFRGLRQDDTRVIMWPALDAGIDLLDGTNVMKNITLHLGTWNSLNTGAAGTNGPTGKLWYENRVYGTLAARFASGLNVDSTFTAYTSPNNAFSSVKELSFKVGADDHGGLVGVALHPYALAAFELDTHPGLGQADGGLEPGTYLELGAVPTWTSDRVSVGLGVREGMSLHNYYELAGVDHTFGFLSVGPSAAVRMGRTSNYGSWNVHGGVEFFMLGDTPKAFNAGRATKMVANVGVGFSY